MDANVHIEAGSVNQNVVVQHEKKKNGGFGRLGNREEIFYEIETVMGEHPGVPSII